MLPDNIKESIEMFETKEERIKRVVSEYKEIEECYKNEDWKKLRRLNDKHIKTYCYKK